MDMERALDLLRGGRDGVDQWNQSVRKSAHKLDLEGADLGQVDVSRAILRQAKLGRVCLRGSVLRSVDRVLPVRLHESVLLIRYAGGPRPGGPRWARRSVSRYRPIWC